MDQIVLIMNTAADFISSSLVNTVLAALIGLGGVDTIVRIIKTDKPVTVLLGLRKLLGGAMLLAKGAIRVLASFDVLLGKLDGVIDRLIPQRLKETNASGVSGAEPGPVDPSGKQ